MQGAADPQPQSHIYSYRNARHVLSKLRRHSLLVVLSSAVGITAWIDPSLWRQVELAASALAIEVRGPRLPRAPVTILAIDDFTLQQAANTDLLRNPLLRQLQQWPWPREVHARLLDRLYAAGVSAVGIDFLFDTPSSHGVADDYAFAAALQRYQGKTVLASMVLESKGDSAGLSLQQPTSQLAKAAGVQFLGLVNGPAEVDGTIRGRPGDYGETLRRQLGMAVPPSLAEMVLKASRQEDRSRPPGLGGSWRGLLDVHGPPRTVRTISVWDVLEDGSYQSLLDRGVLRGQLVLVGPTAALFQDLHRAPYSGAEGMPGVELQATELINRFEGRTLWQWQPGRWWGLCLGMLSLMLGLLAERWDRPMQRLAILGGIAVGFLLIGQLSVVRAGLVLNLFGMAGVVALTALVSTGDATVRLQWKQWRLRQALGRYLSPAVAAEIASQPADADGILGGRSAEVVVLMTDIRGFTKQTREMSDAGKARDLVNQLNSYFTEIVEALHGESATVDKFIGDATLAVFGAPIHRGNRMEAAAALRAALEIRRRLLKLNQAWLGVGLQPWKQVIVLHFGPVISGNVGSPKRMDYTVIGDGVNVASRLESVAKQCNSSLVMSGAFVELLDDSQGIDFLGDYDLRGYGSIPVYGWTE